MIDLMQVFGKYCSSIWNDAYTDCYSQGPLQIIYGHHNYFNLTENNIDQHTYLVNIQKWDVLDLIKYQIESIELDIRNAYAEEEIIDKKLYAIMDKEKIELIITANSEGKEQEYGYFQFLDIPGIVRKITLNRRLFEENMFKNKVENICLDTKIYRNDKAYDAIIVTIDDKKYDFEIKEAT